MNYTYLLQCADGSLYCGWTNRLEDRIAAHNAGRGAKYTKGRRPVKLIYYEKFDTKEEALKREAAIKRLTREQKLALAGSLKMAAEETESAGERETETVETTESESAEGMESKAAGRMESKAAGRTESKAVETTESESAGKMVSKTDGGSDKPQNKFSIIVSPAKKMKICNDDFPSRGLPVFIRDAESLMDRLKEYTEPELKKLFAANDAITHENYLRYRDMDLYKNLTPAVLAYVGIQYQYMAPHIFSGKEWEYVCRHLRILSGFYGILRADDGIVPYRLEMQAKLPVGDSRDLYAFWSDRIYEELVKDGRVILNLASKEYSKAVESHLSPGDRFVTCIFAEEKDGALKVKATEAKMARGEMVRFLAERNAEELDVVKEFDRLGFTYCPERSGADEYVFIKAAPIKAASKKAISGTKTER